MSFTDNKSESVLAFTASSYDLEQVRAYFKFVDGHLNGIQSYNWMDFDSKKPIIGKEEGFGGLDQIFDELVWYSEKGEKPTLHSCLNTTNLKGKRNSDVEGIRVFCVDIDTPLEKEDITQLVESYQCQMLIESSPQKYHLYWKCSPTVSKENWSLIQGGLAVKMGGDLGLTSLCKTIRVPGVPRRCKDGSKFMPRIVAVMEDAAELGVEECKREFGKDILEVGKSVVREKRAGSAKIAKEVSKMGLSNEFALKTARHVPSGERNKTLYNYTKQYIIKGGLNGVGPHVSERVAYEWASLFNAGFEAPLEFNEVEKTVRSAWEHASEVLGKREEKINGKLEEGKGVEVVEEELLRGYTPFQYDYKYDMYIKDDRFSNLGALSRVSQRFYKDIKKVDGILWAFDASERRWKKQKGSEELLYYFVSTIAIDVLRDPFFNIEFGNSENKRKSAVKGFLSSMWISSIVSLIRSYTGWEEKTLTDFDASPTMFYVEHFVLDLTTNEIREPKNEDLLLNRAKVSFKEGADCPYWKTFLKEVFANNTNPEEMCKFIQQVFGYSLTGSISEQMIFVHYGEGCNGKSKVLETLDKLMGEYCTHLSCSSLSKSKGTTIKDIERVGAKIEGKRVVILDDIDVDTKWNEGFVKTLTAPVIPRRKLYEEENEIPNRAKFHIGCNSVPQPESENYGILRRICIIPYLNKFIPDPAKEQEITFNTSKELPGILNWAIEGLQNIIQNDWKIQYTDEVVAELFEYKKDNFKAEATLENLIENTFRKANEEEMKIVDNSVWPTLSDLADQLNLIVAQKGLPLGQIKTIHLGRLLTQAKFSKKEQVIVGGKRVRIYYAVKKADFTNEAKLGYI